MASFNRHLRSPLAISFCLTVLILFSTTLAAQTKELPIIKIGSKAFNESYILAEMAALLLEDTGFPVERRLGLGGTLIAYEALKNGNIDLYPEYSGTITQTILKSQISSWDDINTALQTENLQILPPLGFNNSYALAVSSEVAAQLNLTNISEFSTHPELKVGVSLEFLNREDGWPALSQAYQLQNPVIGIEHALAYAAIESREITATDAYTTDGDIEAYSIVLLDDDLNFFPQYLAVFFTNKNLPANAIETLNKLSGTLSEDTMRKLSAQVSLDKLSPAQVAEKYLLETKLRTTKSVKNTWIADIAKNTLVHLQLTFIALLLAMCFAIPSALLLSRKEAAAKIFLYMTGLFQTIPSLALLALMIPLFGLGKTPAIIALFLYSLLPIFRNTLTGLLTVEPIFKQVATGMGLQPAQQLFKIELPLAAPTIIAGIKTAAIISIGTATLAAFVGAGGLGEPIITGLTLNNYTLILQGAIPAAILALLVELLFERIEKKYQPAYLSPNYA